MMPMMMGMMRSMLLMMMMMRMVLLVVVVMAMLMALLGAWAEPWRLGVQASSGGWAIHGARAAHQPKASQSLGTARDSARNSGGSSAQTGEQGARSQLYTWVESSASKLPAGLQETVTQSSSSYSSHYLRRAP